MSAMTRRLLRRAARFVFTLLGVMSAVSVAQRVGGSLSSTIVDWPAGRTGELMVYASGKELARIPVDAKGRFSFTLPDAKDVPSARAPFDLGAEDGCTVAGDMSRKSLNIALLTFLVAAEGEVFGDVQFANAKPADTAGYAQGYLLHFSETAKLNGTLTCKDEVWRFVGPFQAGWSLVTQTQSGPNARGVVTYTWAPVPAAGMAWRVFAEYGAIAVLLGDGKQGTFVEEVFPDTPAALAGLRVNDLIVTVDGVNVRGWTKAQVSKLLRGAPGSTVTLGVVRNRVAGVLHVSVKRSLQRDP